MDGHELLRRVRQTSNVPVIFLTSKDDDFDEALGLDLGADDYIKKPFSHQLLAKRIKAVLRRPRPSPRPRPARAIKSRSCAASSRSIRTGMRAAGTAIRCA